MIEHAKPGIGGAISLALACLVTFPATSTAQQAETFRLSGSEVAIYNLAGRVQVRGGTGSDVVVSVRRGGSDADRLEMQTGNVNTGRKDFGTVNSLRVVYPSGTVVYGEGSGSSELRVNDDGTFFGDARGGRTVKIRSSGSGLDAYADLEIAVPAGRAVLVALAVGEARVENVTGRLYVDVASADIRSANGNGDFVFDSGSGDVEVRSHDGSLLCDTGSGNVTVEDVAGGELDFDTGSGDVTGRNVRGTSLRADTGSGDVELQNVTTERINVDTGSGNVTLDLVASPQEILVDVGSGDVRIRLPDGYGGRVEVDTGSGDINTAMPIQVTEIDDDTLRGTIGDGSGRLEIDTGSGDVRIETR